MTLYAGLAGGADIILLPEIPYNVDSVCKKLAERHAGGSRFSIIAIAEGAIAEEDSKLTKKELKKKIAEERKLHPSVAYKLAKEIEEKTGAEVRVTVPGHTQRGGQPVPCNQNRSRSGKTHQERKVRLYACFKEYGNCSSPSC